MGVVPAILAGAAIGIGGGMLMSQKKEQPKPEPLPTPPSVDDAANKAQEMARKRKAALSETVYTSPLGVGGTAELAKKKLLGE